MSVATARGEQHVVLSDISWETYERLLAEVGDRAVRLTYDSGELEIASRRFSTSA